MLLKATAQGVASYELGNIYYPVFRCNIVLRFCVRIKFCGRIPKGCRRVATGDSANPWVREQGQLERREPTKLGDGERRVTTCSRHLESVLLYP